MAKVLVVAVHPDDETLGCGGTLLKHKARGDEIYWLICTAIFEKDGFKQVSVRARKDEIDSVNHLFGFNGVYQLDLSTKKVDSYSMSELIGKISGVMSNIEPHIVYLPFKGDAHSDHRKIFKSAFSCTKSFRCPAIRKIYMMETLSETEFAPSTKEDCFIPNVFVDISEHFEEKLKIMRVYKDEMSSFPFPRSEENIRALATLRGATSGCRYAESFMLLKEIA